MTTPESSATTETNSDVHPGTDRRVVLRSAGLAGGAAAAAAALAACGGSSASSGAGSSPAGGGSIATSKVPLGSGVIDNDLKAVVTQPTKGDFKAFSYICTHQGCPVTQISGDTITCPCHGSEFSTKDGSVKNGPASKPLTPLKATVKGSQVIVS